MNDFFIELKAEAGNKFYLRYDCIESFGAARNESSKTWIRTRSGDDLTVLHSTQEFISKLHEAQLHAAFKRAK